MKRWIALAILSASSASAETLYFACDMGEGRGVRVTIDDTTAIYAFRHPTNSLTLTRDVRDVHLTPWSGIGRTIWEEIVFQNAGYNYLVHASIERIYPEDENDAVETNVSGGVIVNRGETQIAELSCAAGTVYFPWGTELFDAKVASGQCYYRTSGLWAAC